MAATFTSGSTTITPTDVTMISVKRDGGSIVHIIPGRSTGAPDITLRPSAMSSGTLDLLFTGTGAEAASETAENAFAGGTVWALTYPERSTYSMPYFIVTSHTREIDDETRNAWTVRVDFQETAA